MKRNFLSKPEKGDEQIRLLIEGSEVLDNSSHMEAVIPMHRKREKIEYA
jgi:hypothetical protein